MIGHGGSASLEIERKYEVIGEAPLPEIELPGAVSIVESRALLVASYWDTQARDLGRAGLALRSRSGGADAGWHVKARGNDGVHEWHWPAADGIPSGALEMLHERLGTHSGDLGLAEALAPVATVRSDRKVLRFLDADGALLVEFADDRVLATDHCGGAAADGTFGGNSDDIERAWREWEAELGAGADPALLVIADSVLRAAGARPSLSDAKIQRALGHTVAAAWQRHAPLSELGACALADLADRIAAAEEGVRVDAPGAAHQLRLLTRRARDLIVCFARDLGAPLAERKAAARALKRLSKLLGAVHVAEVRAVLAERALEAEPAAAGLRRVRRLTVDAAHDARAEAVAALWERIEPGAEDSLAPIAVAGLLRTLAYAAGSEPTDEPDPHVAENDAARADAVAARIDARLGKIDARFVRITATLAAEGGVELGARQLNKIRKKARRVHSAVEAVGVTNGAPPRVQLSDSLASDAHAVQQVLGEIRDSLALAEHLDELAEASIAHPATDAAAEIAARLAVSSRARAQRALAEATSAILRLRTHRLSA